MVEILHQNTNFDMTCSITLPHEKSLFGDIFLGREVDARWVIIGVERYLDRIRLILLAEGLTYG